MNRREIILLSCSIILLFLLIVLLFFSGHRWSDALRVPRPFSDSRFLEMMHDTLDLSDEQYASISLVLTGDKEARDKNKRAVARKFIILDSLLTQERFDETAVRRILEEIDTLMREDRILTIKKKYEIEKYLTPGQKIKMNEHIKTRMKRFRDRFDPGNDRLSEDD